MIYLDATIVNVALPDIQNEFNVGEQGLQWVVAAYSLTMGMFIMSAATLSDQRGPPQGVPRPAWSSSPSPRPSAALLPTWPS